MSFEDEALCALEFRSIDGTSSGTMVSLSASRGNLYLVVFAFLKFSLSSCCEDADSWFSRFIVSKLDMTQHFVKCALKLRLSNDGY